MTTSVLNDHVLLLNRNYEAMRVISVRRALKYLVMGVAEVVDTSSEPFQAYEFSSWAELSSMREEYERDSHKWVRSAKQAITVPTIVRMITTRFFRHARVKVNRNNIYARDNNQCQYCGKTFLRSELNLDHVVPRCQGGQSTFTNLVCSCVDCNTKKGGCTPEQAGMKLIRRPVVPKFIPPTQGKILAHPSWATFVDFAYWNVPLK